MRVNAINSASFGAKTKTDKKENAKQSSGKRYFEWVSKNAANDALKMSKGREEEDGKFKLATALAATSALASAGVSGAFLTRAAQLDKKVEQLTVEAGGNITEKALELTTKSTSKYIKAGYAVIGALALGCAASIIKLVNEHRADKTANERGFQTLNDRRKMNNKETVYSETERIYDEHVK